MSTPPLLALTVGDPAGIGPEIVLRLLCEPPPTARLLVLGDARSLEAARALVPGAPPLESVDEPEAVPRRPGSVRRWARAAELEGAFEAGRVSAACGAVCHRWVMQAADLAIAGRVDGLVTGPIHKAAWDAAGIGSPGHTEALRDRAGVGRVLMMLTGGRLRAALATIHVPLRDVPGLLSAEGLRADVELLARETARLFGPERPRIAVCGLNPHAGEDGLFGSEDRDRIAPAVEAARAAGVDAHGPLPADACIPAACGGAYDAVLAMYHDQALPAVKSVAPRRSVNVTLGLPFVRTSVDHGTAFDIAGLGRASDTSLRAAIDLAASTATRFRGMPAPRSSIRPVPPPT